jgi:hypothetical protein
MNTHLIEAKRSAARCAPDTRGLYPRMHRKLVEAVRAGSQVTESVIVSGLTDKAAYRLESWIIGEFHKHRAGQLWNTIDERFMDPRSLPDEWDLAGGSIMYVGILVLMPSFSESCVHGAQSILGVP